MPSRNNPNVPTSQKRKSSRSKVQKRNATSSSSSSALKTHKKKNPRGTAPSSVLYPTGGPAAPLSGKKARKVERAVMRERRRRMEAAMKEAGEVVMTDAPRTTKPKIAKAEGEERGADGRVVEGMDVDMGIS